MVIICPEILAQPNIIKPLHGLNPRTLMWPTKWQITRQKVYAENNYHCMACGVHRSKAKYKQQLEAHERYTIDFENHNYTLKTIVPLCHYCHSFIHSWLMSIRVRKWELTSARQKLILAHGDELLRKAGIDKLEYIRNICWGDFEKFTPESNWTWNLWWLVIDGKKHYTKYPTYMDWVKTYNI